MSAFFSARNAARHLRCSSGMVRLVTSQPGKKSLSNCCGVVFMITPNFYMGIASPDFPRPSRGQRAAGDGQSHRHARYTLKSSGTHIVLNTTKEDLKSAPEFAWLDEQGAKRSQD